MVSISAWPSPVWCVGVLTKLPDRIPEVLAGNPHGGPRHADDHGHLVVELECPVVYVDLIYGDVVGQITQ